VAGQKRGFLVSDREQTRVGSEEKRVSRRATIRAVRGDEQFTLEGGGPGLFSWDGRNKKKLARVKVRGDGSGITGYSGKNGVPVDERKTQRKILQSRHQKGNKKFF